MRAQVDEEDRTNLRDGQKVIVTLYSFPGRPFSGSVYKIYPQADADRRTFEVDVKLIDPESSMAPGMTGELAFEVASKPVAMVVPAQAVQSGVVWVVRDQKLAKSAAQVPAFAVVQSIAAGTEVTVPVPAMETVSWAVLGPVPSFLHAAIRHKRTTAIFEYRQSSWFIAHGLILGTCQSPLDVTKPNAGPPFGSSAILGSFVACEAGVAEESEDP